MYKRQHNLWRCSPTQDSWAHIPSRSGELHGNRRSGYLAVTEPDCPTRRSLARSIGRAGAGCGAGGTRRHYPCELSLLNVAGRWLFPSPACACAAAWDEAVQTHHPRARVDSPSGSSLSTGVSGSTRGVHCPVFVDILLCYCWDACAPPWVSLLPLSLRVCARYVLHQRALTELTRTRTDCTPTLHGLLSRSPLRDDRPSPGSIVNTAATSRC